MKTRTPTITRVTTRPSRRLTTYWSTVRRAGESGRRRGRRMNVTGRAPRHVTNSVEIDVAEVERSIGHDVDAGELLAVRREKLFDDQRGPGGVLPDRLLRILVELGLLRLVRGGERRLDVVVDLVALIVGGVEQARWERLGREQRPQRPVRLTGRRRPAHVVHPHRRRRGILPAFHFFDSLASLEQRDLGLDTDLAQLLLQELGDFLRD